MPCINSPPTSITTTSETCLFIQQFACAPLQVEPEAIPAGILKDLSARHPRRPTSWFHKIGTGGSIAGGTGTGTGSSVGTGGDGGGSISGGGGEGEQQPRFDAMESGRELLDHDDVAMTTGAASDTHGAGSAGTGSAGGMHMSGEEDNAHHSLLMDGNAGGIDSSATQAASYANGGSNLAAFNGGVAVGNVAPAESEISETHTGDRGVSSGGATYTAAESGMAVDNEAEADL